MTNNTYTITPLKKCEWETYTNDFDGSPIWVPCLDSNSDRFFYKTTLESCEDEPVFGFLDLCPEHIEVMKADDQVEPSECTHPVVDYRGPGLTVTCRHCDKKFP